MEMNNKMNIYLVNSLLLLKTSRKASRFDQNVNSQFNWYHVYENENVYETDKLQSQLE